MQYHNAVFCAHAQHSTQVTTNDRSLSCYEFVFWSDVFVGAIAGTDNTSWQRMLLCQLACCVLGNTNMGAGQMRFDCPFGKLLKCMAWLFYFERVIVDTDTPSLIYCAAYLRQLGNI